MSMQERFNLLVHTAGFSHSQARDVELVLETMPSVTVDISLQTDGEEGGIQEDDLVTMYAWVNLKRRNNAKSALPHAPHYPFYKEENFYLILADTATKEVWMSQRVNFMDEDAAVRSSCKLTFHLRESLGETDEEIAEAVKYVADRVRSGSRQVVGKFMAPGAGTYSLTAYCLCDSWIGCDEKTEIKIKVLNKVQPETTASAGIVDQDREEDEVVMDEDYDSEYSDDEQKE